MKSLKKILLLLTCAMLVLSLTACDGNFDLKAFIKKYMTEDGNVSREEGYIETKQNDDWEYEIYQDHIMLTVYLGTATDVEIPEAIDGLPVTTVGSLCFYSGDTEITSVVIPASVKKLSDSAFYLCTEITSVTVPETVTKIGERCFGWCTKLTSVTLPRGITEIPDYCFNYCTALTDVNVPDYCSVIGKRAFSYCNSLTEFTITDTVVTLGDRAFADCDKLDYLFVPDSVTEIGESILDGSPECLIIASASSPVALYCGTNNLTFYTSYLDAAEAKGDTPKEGAQE